MATVANACYVTGSRRFGLQEAHGRGLPSYRAHGEEEEGAARGRLGAGSPVTCYL